MKIWNRVRAALPGWLSRDSSASTDTEALPTPVGKNGESHLQLARESLRELLADKRVPAQVREGLAQDYTQLEVMLDKIEHGHIHIAVFGRVSVGKSALLNALLGSHRFSTSPLHGETTTAELAPWHEYEAGGVFVVDTPGINEIDGETRERMAREVAQNSDLILFVVDGDMTDTEFSALKELMSKLQPVLVVLNKADRYSETERDTLLGALRSRLQGLVPGSHIIATAAQPAEQLVIIVDEAGRERETRRHPAADIRELKDRLWDILKAEGKTVAALNASLFAGEVSDRVSREVMNARAELADNLIRKYCIGKGIAVGLNPIPLADLLAVAADVAMIIQLGRVYGMEITRTEAGALLRTIAAQLALLMGTVWGVNLLSSALKGVSMGLSTVITASAQGAVAWYGTYVIGVAAQRYFSQGKSWGVKGPKQAVSEILENLDRDSLLIQARDDILNRLKVSS